MNKGLMTGSTSLLVLHLISSKNMYGYEIIKELDAKSSSVFVLKEGTLYPVLHALEQDGFVESYLKTAETGKERKYYQITKKGMAALAQKKAEWKTFSGAVDTVLEELCYAK
jgi:PadR family transcriptional regulator, regulatory protein PadR